jgi:hypothetical protein
MNRLTWRNDLGETTSYNPSADYVAGDNEIRNLLADYEDTGLTPEEMQRVLNSHPVRLEKGQIIVNEKAFNFCQSEYTRLRAELEQYKRALGLACSALKVSLPICPADLVKDEIASGECIGCKGEKAYKCWLSYYLAQAKAVE